MAFVLGLVARGGVEISKRRGTPCGPNGLRLNGNRVPPEAGLARPLPARTGTRVRVVQRVPGATSSRCKGRDQSG